MPWDSRRWRWWAMIIPKAFMVLFPITAFSAMFTQASGAAAQQASGSSKKPLPLRPSHVTPVPRLSVAAPVARPPLSCAQLDYVFCPPSVYAPPPPEFSPPAPPSSG